MIYLEPRSTFDRAIIDHSNDRVIYGYDLIIDVMMDDFDWDYLTAVEWYCENIEPLISYVGLMIRDEHENFDCM